MRPMRHPLLRFKTTTPLTTVRPSRPRHRQYRQLRRKRRHTHSTLHSFILPNRMRNRSRNRPRRIMIAVRRHHHRRTNYRPRSTFRRQRPLQHPMYVRDLRNRRPRRRNRVSVLVPPMSTQRRNPIRKPLTSRNRTRRPRNMFFRVINIRGTLRRRGTMSKGNRPPHRPRGIIRLGAPQPRQFLLRRTILRRKHTSIIRRRQRTNGTFRNHTTRKGTQTKGYIILRFIEPRV